MKPMTSTDKPAKNPTFTVLGTLVGVVAFLVTRYAGINMLIPGVGAAVVGGLCAKFLPPSRKPMVLAIALLAGHGLWMLAAVILGAAMQPGSLATLLLVAGLDALLLLGGAVWLAVRPGTVAVVVLGLFELLCLAVNLNALTHAAYDSAPHKALVAHVALRTFALFATIAGLIHLRRQRTAATSEVAATTR